MHDMKNFIPITGKLAIALSSVHVCACVRVGGWVGVVLELSYT